MALSDLQNEGLVFDVSYQRRPFFLRGSQENINHWMDELGLPHNATRGEVCKKMGWDKGGIWDLFAQAGLDRNVEVCNMGQYADTMDSHRLAWYAATESLEKGELMWRALSRRYFQGKDTAIRPIRLDNREMLLECAKEAGLDLEQATRVLDSDAYRAEILDVVRAMQAAGINSIPVLVFEVEGLAAGSWMQDARVPSAAGDMNPRALAKLSVSPACRGREIHHGSGNKAAFKEIFQRLHAISTSSL